MLVHPGLNVSGSSFKKVQFFRAASIRCNDCAGPGREFIEMLDFPEQERLLGVLLVANAGDGVVRRGLPPGFVHAVA